MRARSHDRVACMTMLVLVVGGAAAAAVRADVTGGTLVNLGTFDGATTGREPLGPLVMDVNGNLFGTSSAGGPHNGGTVFEIAAGTSGIQVLASFVLGGVSTTGSDARGALAIDANGNIFGTTNTGGSGQDGSVFELPSGSGAITPLAQIPFFGSDPQGVVIDGNGNLFGVATSGGTGSGYIFEVANGGSGLTVLATFDATTQGGSAGGTLLLDDTGDLFGTTRGNTFDEFPGLVFELPNGSSTISTIASFGGASGTFSGNDDLVMDAAGDLFGTTSAGGVVGDGTVFEVVAGSGTVTTLASFEGTNGRQPAAGVVMDAEGNLFGTTTRGGDADDGTLFELPAGNATIGTLVSFDGSNGARPTSKLIIDGSGNLFGTTSTGGDANGDGTVFAFGDVTVVPNGGGGGGGGGGFGGGGSSCATISTCLAALDAALPSPASAASRKSRRVATHLGTLSTKLATLIDRAASAPSKKQRKAYRKVRNTVAVLLRVARAAKAKGMLGASMVTIQSSGKGLLGALPS